MERYNDERLIDEKSLAELAKAYSNIYPNFLGENDHIIKRNRKSNDFNATPNGITESKTPHTDNRDFLRNIARDFGKSYPNPKAKPSLGNSTPLYHAPSTPNQQNTARIELLLAEILAELKAIRREINQPNNPPPSQPPRPQVPIFS